MAKVKDMVGIRRAVALSALLLVTSAQADETKALYKTHCSQCHGDDGQAHTARGYLYFARNLSKAGWQSRQTDDDLYDTISNGPSWWSVMPAFKDRLSEADRRALVRVVRDFAR